MNYLLKILIALAIGVFVAFIAGKICQHFGADMFWGWLLGVIAGVAYLVNGPVTPGRV